ncbi:MAG: sulfatase-like hydrolase/transferase [Planctomycetota bacterium]
MCWLVVVLLSCLASLSSRAVAADKPNVLVFFADDLGWADWEHDATVNPNGSPVYQTPNMLRLAREGLVFNNAYASAPVCSPTRASLMTGQTSARHDFTDHSGGGANSTPTLSSPSFTRTIQGSATTLAESLGSSAGGYDTGFIGKWHAGGQPTNHGFDYNIAGGGAGCPCNPVSDGFFAGSDGRWSGMPGIDSFGQFPADTYLTDVLSDFAEDYIADKANDPDPFFLMMAPYQVHVPLQAPAATITKYQNRIAQLQSQGVDLQGHDNPIYAAMVEEMDKALGRALDRLDDPNGDGDTSDSIRDNTIVMLASDNGGLTIGELGSAPATENGPLRSGKGSVYEGGIRTTFITSWTGNANIAQNTTTNARVSTHDIYPTLLELADLDSNPSVPRNANMDGVSFAGALEGGAHDRGYQYFHYPHRSNQDKLGGSIVTGGSFVSAIRDDDHKLIFFYETRDYELYNLTNDIGETTDLLSLEPQKAFELSLALNMYLREVGAGMPIAQITGQPVAAPNVLWLTPEGDFNGDGVINIQDWTLLRNSVGNQYSVADTVVGYQTGGDINLDGVIDRDDFAAFKDAFNGVNGPGAFSRMLEGVPEPTSVIPATIIIGSLLARRDSR